MHDCQWPGHGCGQRGELHDPGDGDGECGDGDNTAYVVGGGDPNCTGTNCPGTVTVPVNSPKLTITKSATPNPFIVGQAASYTITVTNTGTAATTAVSTITDTIPTGLTIGTLTGTCTNVGQAVTCTIPSGMATGAGNAVSFTIPVTVTASAANGDNTAYVVGGGDPNCTGTNCPGTVTVPVNSPKLTITKSATPNPFIVGQAASYTITVTNTGTAATTAVSTITDTIPTGLTIGTLTGTCTNVGQAVTCTIPSGMATGAGNAVSFTIPVTVTASAANGDNTAYVVGGGDPNCTGTNCPGTVTVPVNSPKLTITKSATPNPFIVGQAASYTITVTNTGTAATTAVSTITDTIPTGLTIGTLTGTCTNVGQAVTCTIPSGMATGAGNAVSFTIPVTVTASAANGDNTAYVVGGGDPNCTGTNCPGTVTVPVNSPKLTITKTASDATFVVGQPASYTITVTNTGTAATTAVSTVTDVIPTGMTIGTPLPANCSAVAQTITCTIASGLATGAGSAVSFVIPVTPTAAAGTSVSNTASVTGGGDPACVTDTDCVSTVTVPLNTAANITLVKSGPAAALTNDSLVYTIALGNSGQTDSGTTLTVADILPPGVTYVSAAAGTNVTSVTCTGAPNLSCSLNLTAALTGGAANGAATFTITATAPATAGDITNYAAVDPSGGTTPPTPGPTCAPTSSCGSAPTTISTPVNVTLIKSSPAQVDLGGNLVYTIALGNSGDTASGTTLTVVDMLPTGVTYQSVAAGTNVTGVSCVGAPNLVCTVDLATALAPHSANGAASFTDRNIGTDDGRRHHQLCFGRSEWRRQSADTRSGLQPGDKLWHGTNGDCHCGAAGADANQCALDVVDDCSAC